MNLISFCISPIRFLQQDKRSFGQRLCLAMQAMGPIYVKLGQTLSTRPDLIGFAIAEDLKSLQDKLPPFSFQEVQQKIKRSFGKDINELFTDFINEPIASASIAQVHKAKLQTGEMVAVKIMRPGIHKIYVRDLDLFYFIANLLEKFFPTGRRLRLTEVVKIFEKTMHFELDFSLEAAASSELKDNMIKNKDVYIPKVYWNLTNRDVLTTEWINGISIYDTKRLQKAHLSMEDIAKKLVTMFLTQAYRDGYFHADLHPGNIFITTQGQIALVDFGIMGRLSQHDRVAVAHILHGFFNRQYLQVAKLHVEVGYVPKDTDIYAFAHACRAIGEPIMGLPVSQISIAKLMGQLLKVTEDFSMQIQPQLVLLQKTMVVVEGIGQKLDPNINMWSLAIPWFKNWALDNISVEAKTKKFITNLIKNIAKKIHEDSDLEYK